MSKTFLLITIAATVIGLAFSLIQGQWVTAVWQFTTILWVKGYMNLYGKFEERSEFLIQSLEALKKIAEKVEEAEKEREAKQQTQTN